MLQIAAQINLYLSGFWQPWTAVKGQYLNSGANKINEADTDALRSCMSRCVNYVEGSHCRSIIKSTSDSKNNTCELKTKRSDDANVQSDQNDDWQYFDRPHWYLGKMQSYL